MNKGSIWRRWELHLHTPDTRKEDRYEGNTSEEKWDNFYSAIVNYIGDGKDPRRAICAIAITDYLSIDNYLKVCNDKRLPQCVKLVFPNVELRIKPIASDSPINIHCLFAPDIAMDLEDRFFAHLKFEYNHNQYSATKRELIRLGRDVSGNTSLSEQGAYIKGVEQYVISPEILSEIFNNNPQLREKTIIVVSNKSKDGASGLNLHSGYLIGNISQLEATRRSIYQLSDMIFSSNPKDIQYFLGEGVDSPDEVKEKCGSLMPCIHGCDAHRLDKIFAPDDDRYCWIKAEPTFEGLKQVLYEPKERVHIGNTVPDSKSDYYVIDRVEIEGNKDFSPSPIYFNDKLTCIIGGKSTGKSLLLHNMAMAIDEDQVQKKAKTVATNVKRIPELKVYWCDGICSSDKEKQRKIIYIPQTYLNQLSDEEQETTEIDKIIQDIVLQDEKCFRFYQLLNQNISEKKQAFAKEIVDFVKTFSDKQEMIEKCREIGEQKAIQTEIDQLTSRLEQLSKEYNVTELEIKTYQSASEKVQSLKSEHDTIYNERSIIDQTISVVEVKNYNNYELSIFRKLFIDAVSKVKEVADSTWQEQRNHMIKYADEKICVIENEIEQQSKIVAELQPKMEGNEQIHKLSSEIVENKARLTRLTEIENQLKILQETYNKQLKKISNVFGEFASIYQNYANSVNNNFEASIGDLEFSVKGVLRIEQLSKKVSDIINNKSYSRFKQVIDLHEMAESDLIPQNIAALIESILSNSNESLQLKGNYNIESALREILTDWYNINYVVKMDGDSIQDMSPGKKALVLLRLLISLAESKCPILIDQPEDDLDNRSIYEELIHFIREKKVDRQIITVTHNANIVLGGDAELVIVANQRGKNAPNEQYRFEYRGGAIEDNTPVLNNGIPVSGILNRKGIQEHICEILEGGEQAFALRQNKYHFIKH